MVRGVRIAATLGLAMLCTGAARPTGTCVPDFQMFFFDWGSAELSGGDQDRLARTIRQSLDCMPSAISVAGHNDSSEAEALAWKRADAVHAFVRAHGFPEKQIIEQAYGSQRPRVQTASGIREPMNRRVEIMFGPAFP